MITQTKAKIFLEAVEMLDAGCSCTLQAEENSHIILLPLSGGINVKDNADHEVPVAAGQFIIFNCCSGSSLQIINPCDERLVNFLQIGIKADNNTSGQKYELLTYRNVNGCNNELIEICDHSLFTLSIGKFEGRGEAVYKRKNGDTGFFVFVIQGAFETEGRLLHERDGLALWNTPEIEMEALSNDAIILVIEYEMGDAH